MESNNYLAADVQIDRGRDTSHAAVCDRQPIIAVVRRAGADECLLADAGAETDDAEAAGGVGAAVGERATLMMMMVVLADPSQSFPTRQRDRRAPRQRAQSAAPFVEARRRERRANQCAQTWT
jgi:hypothetical protein